MKILIATPIYPPEIGAPASYVKELAKRLVENHEVTIVVYGRLPEKVPGVSFVCINKQKPLLIRLLHFVSVFLKEAKKVDIIYAENGASVELPLSVVSLFVKKPVIFHIGDKLADEKTKNSQLQKRIKDFVQKRARKVLTGAPPERPEILPFDPVPQSEFDACESSWTKHINTLEDLFKNAK